MKARRIHSCQILHTSAEQRQLWQFRFSEGNPVVDLDKKAPLDEALPPAFVAKKWQYLWQPKINLAWLPLDQVYLRVIQLPATDPAELPAMVELQIEKLSPMPANQVVWSFETISPPSANFQSVIIAIAPRSFVEQYLGQLEGLGYLADRLELPAFHLLKNTPAQADGVWIYASIPDSPRLCLVGWWQQGVLLNLNLLPLAATPNWGDIVCQQLTEIAWSGEMEGWLVQPPQCHLVADAETSANWAPILNHWAQGAIDVLPSLTLSEAATTSAARLGRDESRLNLLPVEYGIRYRQQFIDQLWMGGLAGVLGIYLIFVFLYLGALQVLNFEKYRVESQIIRLEKEFQEARQLKARVQVLQEQVNLRFAALECWKAACMLLPEGLILDDLQIQQGKTLRVVGNAPAADVNKILLYNERMGKHQTGDGSGALLFKTVNPFTQRAAAGGLVTWDFSCELNRTELE